MNETARGQTTSLSPEALEDYMSAGVPTNIRHGRSARHLLRIDPLRKEFTLRSPADGTYEDGKELENVVVELDEAQGNDEYVLTVSAEEAPDAAYALAYSVVRQCDAGLSYAQALTSAVDQFRNLLRARRRLSPTQEVGLIGELTVLLHLLERYGAEAAVEAWLGPDAEEHDFALARYGLEVKTTLTEERKHMIHGLDQLTPTGEQELWVLSLQFTAAGHGAGQSLTHLALRAIAEAGPQSSSVRRALDAVGWREQDAELYTKRFTLRTTPRCYVVDEHFPAITRERVEESVPNPGLIGQDVSYRVDVGPLPYGLPGPELQDFVEEAHHD